MNEGSKVKANTKNVLQARKRVRIRQEKSKLRDRLEAHLIHFLKVATPHGLIHLVRPHRACCEKLFWIACMFLVSIPCVIISMEAWNRYWYNPTVTTLNRDHRLWYHTFPAVTICPRSLPSEDMNLIGPVYEFFSERGYNVNVTEIEEYDEEDATPKNDSNSVLQRKIAGFISALLFGNFSTYGNLEEYKEEFDQIDPNDFLTLNDLSAQLGNDIQTELGNGQYQVIITKSITEFGICFSVNSLLANYSTFEAWKNKDMSFNENPYIIINKPSEEDPMLQWNNFRVALILFYHSYNEIITLKDQHFHLGTKRMATFVLGSQKHWATENVRNLPIAQRRCRFTEESNLRYFPAYSYKLCQLECRMRLALKYCKCLPYYYRNLYGETVCSLDGMICLSRHADTLIDLKHNKTKKSLCNRCLPNCEMEVLEYHIKGFEDWVFDSLLQTSLLLYSSIRVQRNVIYSEVDFLVQIGGLVGLAYGLSILSFVEIVYFLTLRFFWGVVRERKV